MTTAAPMVEVWRGPFCESLHHGHAVVWDAGGGIVAAWGDPDAVILPRSSSKMIQALPLIESGAAAQFGLGDAQLALACASHQGEAVHTSMVGDWLAALSLSEGDLRCGSHLPYSDEARNGLVCSHTAPDQRHNNCSGKHTGFLTLNKQLGGGSEYVDPDHPVQKAILAAFEDVTGENSPGYGIDGCSAPNSACTVTGFARALASYARPGPGVRGAAQARLTHAMASHPDLVAGEGRACTVLMRAMGGKVAIKTGAEAVFAAILPDQGIGIAVKIEDGTTRASEAVITQLLIGAGVLDAANPAARTYTHGPITNRRDVETGHYRVAESLSSWRL